MAAASASDSASAAAWTVGAPMVPRVLRAAAAAGGHALLLHGSPGAAATTNQAASDCDSTQRRASIAVALPANVRRAAVERMTSAFGAELNAIRQDASFAGTPLEVELLVDALAGSATGLTTAERRMELLERPASEPVQEAQGLRDHARTKVSASGPQDDAVDDGAGGGETSAGAARSAALATPRHTATKRRRSSTGGSARGDGLGSSTGKSTTKSPSKHSDKHPHKHHGKGKARKSSMSHRPDKHNSL